MSGYLLLFVFDPSLRILELILGSDLEVGESCQELLRVRQIDLGIPRQVAHLGKCEIRFDVGNIFFVFAARNCTIQGSVKLM